MSVCSGCGCETIDDQVTCGHPDCPSRGGRGWHLAASAVGARFVRSIGDGPAPITTLPPRDRFTMTDHFMGHGGQDIDDLALILGRLGYGVDLVQVQEHGGCRLRDRKTGQWFVQEEGTGYVFLVATHPLAGAP